MDKNMQTAPANELRAVLNWQIGEIQGVILTHIESLGLPEKQENAIKSMLKRDLWDWWHRQHIVIDVGEGKLEYTEENFKPGK